MCIRDSTGRVLQDPQATLMRIFGVGTPGAVLLGGDGLLAGGPVRGTSAVADFVVDVLVDRNHLDEQLGLLAATATRDKARRALIDWGLGQVRTLWPTCRVLFPGHSLTELERLFARPEAQRRLVPIILKLQDWA